MSYICHDTLTREGCDAEQEAERVLTCKRKAVCTSIYHPGEDIWIRFFNGPIDNDSSRCTNQTGGCGCIHSEFKAMTWLLQTSWIKTRKVQVVVTHSPCTPCANLIYLCRDFIESVHWLYDTPHDMRGIEILEAAGFREIGKL